MNETGGTTPGFNRRDVMRAAIVGGAAVAATTALPGTAGTASAAPKPLRQQPILPKPGRSVAIFGGGMAGLSAAHELAERGYAVTVYEPSFLGGKARSMDVPNTAAGGRKNLPGEHGFRFFPGCYQHVPDTMSRIPFPGNPQGVLTNLRAVDSSVVGIKGSPAIAAPFSVAGISQITPETIEKALITAVGFIPQLPPLEMAFFVKMMMMWFTSSEERRFGQWEYMTWENALKAEGKSQAYRDYLVNALTRITVAAKPHVSSARTIATIGEALVLAATGIVPEYKGGADRILNRPTNEAWIDPWVAYLRSRGVQFIMGQRAVRLNVEGGRISSVTMADGSGARSTVHSDYYVASMPVDKAQPLITDEVMNADPHLAGIHKLYADWMVGIQFYMTRQSGLPEGHIACMGSPWAITGLRQAPMWANNFQATYGDGTVVECLSIDVSDWDTPGILFGKPAKQCTKEEVRQEVWAQAKMWLNTGRNWLRDEDIHSWHLDPGLTWSGGTTHNETPLLVNTVGSWDWRPNATTAIPNLFIGGDHVRTHIDLPTMEAANESGRAAANGIMNAAGDPGGRAAIFPLVNLPIFDAAKKIDADRFRAGQPHLLDG
ncbi:hydroxysqualene dehydroxylase [Aldersonia kunmingensis]|uniref:hydroxysqualene dehydroxylase n=1 Tax=Aldersonia kunmingensis TaxID=408066 RepID=UPI00082BF052|nr:FAD-dependent oxidoreductase [Aldersonia kunmingensis]